MGNQSAIAQMSRAAQRSYLLAALQRGGYVTVNGSVHDEEDKTICPFMDHTTILALHAENIIKFSRVHGRYYHKKVFKQKILELQLRKLLTK